MATRGQLLEAIRVLKQYKRVTSGKEVIGIETAITELRKIISELDTKSVVCNNIGNKYIFHTDQKTLTDYQEGYNAAIRDALEILERTDEDE